MRAMCSSIQWSESHVRFWSVVNDICTVANIHSTALSSQMSGFESRSDLCRRAEYHTLQNSQFSCGWSYKMHSFGEYDEVYFQVFKGNRDNNSVVINSLPNPIKAKYVRFIPQSWKNSIALRVEVYGEVTGLLLSFVCVLLKCRQFISHAAQGGCKEELVSLKVCKKWRKTTPVNCSRYHHL